MRQIEAVTDANRSSYAQITGIKGAKGCFHFTAAHLWPYKFVLHLLNLVVSKGVNLQTNTPVVIIDEHPDKHGRWHVHTKDRGVIKAEKVIFATNAYTPGVAPQYQRQIVPIRGYVTRIVAPDGKPAPYFPITTTLQWRAWEFDYVIARPDGSIIVGGGKKAHAADFNCWYDNVNDNDSMEYTRAYFEMYMQRHFIGWEDSEAHLDRAWTGSKCDFLGYFFFFFFCASHLGLARSCMYSKLIGKYLHQSWVSLQMAYHTLVKCLGRLTSTFWLDSMGTACQCASLLLAGLHRWYVIS